MEHSKAFLQGRKGGGESAVPGGRCKRRLEATDMARAANDLYRGRAQGRGDWRLGESSGPGLRGASPSSAGCWGGCFACSSIIMDGDNGVSHLGTPGTAVLGWRGGAAPPLIGRRVVACWASRPL